MRFLHRIDYLLFVLITPVLPAMAQDDSAARRHGSNPHYRPGDWLSYGVTRYVTSVATGTQEVYFGTTGGITRYDLFHDRWNAPITVSDGLAANQITVVAFDAGAGIEHEEASVRERDAHARGVSAVAHRVVARDRQRPAHPPRIPR